ncbi:MAG: hypothetical protein WKF84_00715 [Pyrinomonadaceae bacterium]
MRRTSTQPEDCVLQTRLRQATTKQHHHRRRRLRARCCFSPTGISSGQSQPPMRRRATRKWSSASARRKSNARRLRSEVRALGTIFPREQATVSSNIGAQIKQMRLLKNQVVRQGEVIAALDIARSASATRRSRRPRLQNSTLASARRDDGSDSASERANRKRLARRPRIRRQRPRAL